MKWPSKPSTCRQFNGNLPFIDTVCSQTTIYDEKITSILIQFYFYKIVPWKPTWLDDVQFFPTCQVKGSRFYQNASSFSLSFFFSSSSLGSQLRVPDRSGHCRTSTARSRSQWALPGPQPHAPDLGVHCRTSTASSRSQWATQQVLRGIVRKWVCLKMVHPEFPWNTFW